MVKNLKPIDTVRASREGHEFHEAWTARKALQLLLPTGNLVGIAVEGLHPADQAAAASETVEIADITLYYGKSATFKGADRVSIVQFKYSMFFLPISGVLTHGINVADRFVGLRPGWEHPG